MQSKVAKSELREKYKTLLEAMSFESLIQKSFKLRDHFLQNLIEPNAQITREKYVVSFYPFDFEPQINIEDEARFEPFKIAYVRITDWKERVMECRKARRDQPGDWEEIEPVADVRIFQPAASQDLCRVDEVGIILVPGLAFTEEGMRLGRGAGFYDRFLPQYPEALRVGLAFHEQISNSVPTEAWDQPLDMVLTDEGVFRTKRFSEWQIHGKVLERK